jgi:hypothetical protein
MVMVTVMLFSRRRLGWGVLLLCSMLLLRQHLLLRLHSISSWLRLGVDNRPQHLFIHSFYVLLLLLLLLLHSCVATCQLLQYDDMLLLQLQQVFAKLYILLQQLLFVLH